MIRPTILSLAYVVATTALLALGCQRAAKPAGEGAASPSLEPEAIRVTGPFAHRNVSVFLIHNDKQDERDFITLDQGLKQGSVTVTESAHQRVNELQIDNQSDRPLFLQEGDRLYGGNQDRTIFASLVIPPKSGKTALPAFCIEQGRWHPSSMGSTFSCPVNLALAGKEVRLAAKYSKDQARVWESVRAAKEVATLDLKAPNSTTSNQ
jgi:hypothetical protein